MPDGFWRSSRSYPASLFAGLMPATAYISTWNHLSEEHLCPRSVDWSTRCKPKFTAPSSRLSSMLRWHQYLLVQCYRTMAMKDLRPTSHRYLLPIVFLTGAGLIDLSGMQRNIHSTRRSLFICPTLVKALYIPPCIARYCICTRMGDLSSRSSLATRRCSSTKEQFISDVW